MYETDEANGYTAPALEKGLDILEILCQSESGLTQQEIAAKLGRKLSEIYRMLNCLVKRKYVVNVGSTYSISTKLYQLSHFHPPTYRLLTESLPIMESLSRKIAYPCDLRIYNNGMQTVIAAIQPPNGLGFMSRIGAEIEVAPSASGLVLLAFQDPVLKEIRLQESLRMYSDDEKETFRKRLEEIKVKGFASIKSNQFAGLHAISYPVLDLNNYAIAAITVPMLSRIDGSSQCSVEQVESAIRDSIITLQRKINTSKN
jgi:DNA-binding IclR family transcriptional regulator